MFITGYVSQLQDTSNKPVNGNEYNGALGAASNKKENMGNTGFPPTGHGHVALSSLRGRFCLLEGTSEHDYAASLFDIQRMREHRGKSTKGIPLTCEVRTPNLSHNVFDTLYLCMASTHFEHWLCESMMIDQPPE